MPDTVEPRVRSRIMARIRGKDTAIERLIRVRLHALGFRYRLHDKRLVGRPDLVLPKCRALILIHGCFWHGHSCHLFRWPSTRPRFWRSKILGNRSRDRRNMRTYAKAGWRVAVVWECALRGADSRTVDRIAEQIANWLSRGRGNLLIPKKVPKGRKSSHRDTGRRRKANRDA